MAQITTAYRGRDFLLQIASDVSPTTFTSVGGLRVTEMTINNNPVDITNVGSQGFREYLVDAGVQSFSMTGNGVVSNGAADNQLFLKALNRVLLSARVISGKGDKFIGDFVVVSYQRGGQYDGAETFQVSLESSGLMVYQSS